MTPAIPDPDTPPPDPNAPFEPIVESLLKHPVGSREYESARRMAGPAEISEARRQIRLTLQWEREHQAEVHERIRELEDEFPGIEDSL
jgi:hypothetical protein